MTRIDFYLLDTDDTEPEALDALRLAFAWRIIRKARASGLRIFVHAPEHESLERLSALAISFGPEADTDHRLLSANESEWHAGTEAILLSSGRPPSDRELLVNLGSEVPSFFSRFRRTVEIVPVAGKESLAARERWRFYQSRGYPLQHHRIEHLYS